MSGIYYVKRGEQYADGDRGWVDNRDAAYSFAGNRLHAKGHASTFEGARVVKVTTRPVRKPPVVEVRDGGYGLRDLYINDRYIALSHSGALPEIICQGADMLASRIRAALGV